MAEGERIELPLVLPRLQFSKLIHYRSGNLPLKWRRVRGSNSRWCDPGRSFPSCPITALATLQSLTRTYEFVLA